MKMYRKNTLVFIIVLITITSLIYYENLRKSFYIIAYKEKCMISLRKIIIYIKDNENEINYYNKFKISTASDICDCIVDRILISDYELNTSKLHLSKMIESKPQEFIPIDQFSYKHKCVKFKNNY